MRPQCREEEDSIIASTQTTIQMSVPAVHKERLSVDTRRLARQEENNHERDLVRFSHALP